MPILKLSYFGPGQVLLSPNTEAKIQSRKEFGLLAYLAVEHQRAHARDSVLGLFWPELSEGQARNNMRVSLARLRKAIDHKNNPLILSDRRTLQFEPNALQPGGAAWLDVAELTRLLSTVNAHDHADPTQCPACLADMTKAVALYQNEFLSGFHLDGCEAFEQWLLVERERHHMQIITLLPRLEAAHMGNQDWSAAESTVRHRLALDPADEDAHRTLMRILTFGGLRNAALAHYDICVHTLDEELGVSPDEETIALVEQIRAGDLRFQIDDLRGNLAGNGAASNAKKIVNLDPFAILSRLDPLPNQTLFGVDRALETVCDAIDAVDQSWLISIEGIGGLGKTTLANALVKERLETNNPATMYYQDIGWVSAKQEEYLPDRGVQSTGKPALDEESLMDQLLAQLADGPYPTGSPQEKRLALTQLLKEKTCLIVIDNLETAIDYQALLPLLRHLANPTKFLITSRVTLSGQGDLFCYSLAELAHAEALAFLRHEAKTRGLTNLMAANDEQLSAIYATVGGNPLALKLVIGQLQFLPLEQILTSLRQADAERADQLYTYIYWQAWQMLEPASRHLLLCLPVVPNATFAQLTTISGLAVDALQTAIMDLRALSLIELGGDLNEPRYHLHRLTETFLMYEVVKWQELERNAKERDDNQKNSSQETTYFVQRVLHMVQQWNEAKAVHTVDVAILDHEFESVVKAISLGLELEEGWIMVKPLIIAFTPFMERRGHWHTWHSILERAISTANRAQDLDGEITLTALLARLCQRESRPKDVVYYYRRVIRMARRSGNQFEEARACSNLGYAYIDGGRWWRSEVLSCHALKVFEELDSEHGRAHTHNHLGLLYTHQEKWDSAESNLILACNIWEGNQDSQSLISGYSNLGLLYVSAEKPKSALKHLIKASQIAESTGELSTQARIWNNIAFAYRLDSELDKAEHYARKAETLFKKQSDFSGLARVWNNLGLISHGSGRREIAHKYLEESLNLHMNLNNQSGVSIVQQDLMKIAA